MTLRSFRWRSQPPSYDPSSSRQFLYPSPARSDPGSDAALMSSAALAYQNLNFGPALQWSAESLAAAQQAASDAALMSTSFQVDFAAQCYPHLAALRNARGLMPTTINPNSLHADCSDTRQRLRELSISSSGMLSDASSVQDIESMSSRESSVSTTTDSTISDSFVVSKPFDSSDETGGVLLSADHASSSTMCYGPVSLIKSREQDTSATTDLVIKREQQWMDASSFVPEEGFAMAFPSTSSMRPKKRRTGVENAKFRCHICNRPFTRGFNCRAHVSTHDPDRVRPFPCKKGCGRRFHRDADLRRHDNSVHSRTQDWDCHQCGSKFPRKDSLARHLSDGCAYFRKGFLLPE